jgi:hypothetical protein
VHFAVDAQAHEALRAQLVEQLGLLALAACSPLRPTTSGASTMSRVSSGSCST